MPRFAREVPWLALDSVSCLEEGNLVVAPSASLRRYHPAKQKRSAGARFFGREVASATRGLLAWLKLCVFEVVFCRGFLGGLVKQTRSTPASKSALRGPRPSRMTEEEQRQKQKQRQRQRQRQGLVGWAAVVSHSCARKKRMNGAPRRAMNGPPPGMWEFE